MYFAPLVGEIGTDKDGVDFVKLCVRAHNSDVDDAGVHQQRGNRDRQIGGTGFSVSMSVARCGAPSGLVL